MKHTKKIVKIGALFREDQADRKDGKHDPSYVVARDTKRARCVRELIKNNDIKTGADYYNAAMIFHHSQKRTDHKNALELAEKSVALRYQKAKWLYAAITDRNLIMRNKLQKYGTQFFRKNANAPLELLPYDPNTTDEERAQFNVPPLAETLQHIEKMNGRMEHP